MDSKLHGAPLGHNWIGGWFIPINTLDWLFVLLCFARVDENKTRYFNQTNVQPCEFISCPG